MLSSHEVARWGICGHKHWEDRGSARPRTIELHLQQVEGSKIVLASKLDVRWRCGAFSCLDGRLRQRSRSARNARFSCLMGLDAPEGWVAARMAMAELARAIRRSRRHHRREATNRPAPSVSCSAPQGVKNGIIPLNERELSRTFSIEVFGCIPLGRGASFARPLF